MISNKISSQFYVMPAESVNNCFRDAKIQQNPGLADNNWSGSHNDSYCSDSVGLSGPTGKEVNVIKKFNPYGFTPIMACNKEDQMIGISLKGEQFTLVAFDTDCNILATASAGTHDGASFAGGYFYLNQENDAVVVADGIIKCFETNHVESSDEPIPLKWKSKNIASLVAEKLPQQQENQLYCCMPVWSSINKESGAPDTYWCLLSGKVSGNSVVTNACIAVVQISPNDAGADSAANTTLLACKELKNQWCNNVFAVDEDGAYLVTNKCNAGRGKLLALKYEERDSSILVDWKAHYTNDGYRKPGQKNNGSGTTPTILCDGTSKYVAITDNAIPQMNVVIFDKTNGFEISKVPVFPKMRGCCEASMIGVEKRLVVGNNFGHAVKVSSMLPQTVSNEPGMAMIKVDSKTVNTSTMWENDTYTVFGMSILARESGVIYAFSGDWSDEISATEGGMYYIHAIDSWDGRVIWRVPIGRGFAFRHDFGGIYFNLDGKCIYTGTNNFLVSVQNISD